MNTQIARRGPLRRRTLRTRLGTALLGVLLTAGPVAASAQAAGEWNPGKHDEDTVINCITQQPAPGVSADVGWRSETGQVPKVGEVFYVRGYAGLVSLPCSGSVAVLPELMLPAGVVPADDKAPIYWDLTKSGTSQALRTTKLTFANGRNGGYLIGSPEGLKWELRVGDVLEIQVPVVATRELKGPATQQPECQTRLDGTAPCPINQAGDHLQIAFTVAGHGGTKSYVTPYVGLFASPATAGPTGPTTGTTQAASATRAAYQVGKRRAVVTITSTGTLAGTVVITDKGKKIASAKVTGRVTTLKLPRLKKGRHVLVARYSGTSQVLASTSAPTKVTVR
ncbi:Ig-like domain repeat protein [Nocardioides oleivorans]|uniref:Ig-like domain repeat protein n=1 Tax=Nocardioides oleivorans TaxID=273676 RepID=A0A4Q2S507_9ACTN|nr:Ig-like domain-containing protein [Nocardioides oleivorans]RYB95604.1 Ig-like domain repeat protein [Nocardioides oleivorans]